MCFVRGRNLGEKPGEPLGLVFGEGDRGVRAQVPAELLVPDAHANLGLLLVVAYRAFVLREEAWDLMALLIVSGVVGFGYRVRAGVANGRLAMIMVGAAALAAIAALALGLGIGR